MAKYTLKFRDANALNPIEFENARNFQWSDTRNKSGKANFALDLTPTSRRIHEGWQVEIFRDGNSVYWGKVLERSVKQNQIKLFAEDCNGMLNRKQLFQRAIVDQEASLEVIEKLHGLELAIGVVLNASKFIDKSSTSSKWHWEDNSFLSYIVDIGETIKNLSGKPIPYYIWIDSEFNVHWKVEGNEDYYKDLNIKNITLQGSIKSTYNDITVKGNPINIIPYDRDFWTEIASIESWGVITGSSVYTYQKTGKMGTTFLRSDNSGSTNSITKHITQNNESTYNFENVESLTFWLRPEIGSTVSSFSIILHDGTNARSYNWLGNNNYDSTLPQANVWKEWIFDLTEGYSGSSMDITATKYFTIEIVYTSSGYHLDVDGLYFILEIYQHTEEDFPSIFKYGRSSKTFIERTYYSNAETQTLAEILLSHYKDAKLTFNGSIDGYAELKPNSLLEFEHEGIVYRKPLSSATHYVAVNGSESCQLTFGDFKKTSVDKILEKLAEVNRNYNLLENPYKLA